MCSAHPLVDASQSVAPPPRTSSQFGMEMYARFAHKSLWHEFAPGWALHKSHHEPRVGPFEANDIFAIINGTCAV